MSEQVAKKERGRRQVLEGTVVNDKLSQLQQKTITVQVMRSILHPAVKKYVRRRKNYLVHDENSECRMGDRVMISATRPISKRKRWKVAKIVEKAQ